MEKSVRLTARVDRQTVNVSGVRFHRIELNAERYGVWHPPLQRAAVQARRIREFSQKAFPDLVYKGRNFL